MTKKFLIFFGWSISIILVLYFIGGPLVNFFFRSSLTSVSNILHDDAFYFSLLRSIMFSFVATVVVGFLSLPLIYTIARRKFFGKGLVWSLFQIPAFIPHVASGIALLGFFAAQGGLGNALIPLGRFVVNTPLGIMLAMAFVSIPYFFNAMLSTFESLPQEMEWLAQTAGISGSEVFYKVVLPATKRNILYAMANMFSRGASEFGAVLILAYYPKTFPIYLFDTFLTHGLHYALAAIAVIVFILLVFFSIVYAIFHSQK